MTKYCEDCKFFKRAPDEFFSTCSNENTQQTIGGLHYVHKPKKYNGYCKELRSPDGACGPQAKFFEEKEKHEIKEKPGLWGIFMKYLKNNS